MLSHTQHRLNPCDTDPTVVAARWLSSAILHLVLPDRAAGAELLALLAVLVVVVVVVVVVVRVIAELGPAHARA